MRLMECSETVTAALLDEIREDYDHQADLERLCHQSEMLSMVERTIGIFFAREDN
jgi:nucleoside diphosphate kinase